jgi:general nucleoside transport system permease protein
VSDTTQSEEVREPSRWQTVLREIAGGSIGVSVLAVVVGLVVGAVFIAIFNNDDTFGYFFSRPADTFSEIGQTYQALFNGAIFGADGSFLERLAPLTDTLYNATPLVAAGLGVALAFRVGMFNIGGRGQATIGAVLAALIVFNLHLPGPLSLILGLIAGLVGGVITGGVVGALRAWTGAHEVITTIMLNYVAFYLLTYLLKQPALRMPGQISPKTSPVPDASALPQLFPVQSDWVVDWGFVIVLALTIGAAWLLNRSGFGFQMRAVGLNASAARVAGIDVKRVYFVTMLIAGGLAGLGGVLLMLSFKDHSQGLSPSFDAARIGFDAITVALLGRSRPWGVFGAALLFGALRAGSFDMQAYVPIDLISIIQSVIVLLIAAPPLVRTIFRLPKPTGTGLRTPSLKKAVISR